jgi:hypothetical protein
VDYLTGQGQEVVVRYTPSRQQTAHSIGKADGLFVITHGNESGMVMESGAGQCFLTAAWLKRIRNGRKLEFLLGITCTVINGKKTKEWNKSAKRVAGFDSKMYPWHFAGWFDKWIKGEYTTDNKALPRLNGGGAIVPPTYLFGPRPVDGRPR